MDADRIFDINEFRRRPETFYTAARDFIYTLHTRTPGPVHELFCRYRLPPSESEDTGTDATERASSVDSH